MSKSSLATAAVAFASLLAAAGCGGESTDGGQSGSSGEVTVTTADVAKYLEPPDELPVTTPVSKPIPGGLTIAIVSNGTPQVQKVAQGIEEAASVLDWTVRTSTYDATNPATLTTAIESAIAEKPAAVVLASVQYEQYQSVVPAAVEAGVPIVTFGSPNADVDGVYAAGDTSIRSTYNGRILGETLVADAAAKGENAEVVQLTVSAFKAILGYFDDSVAAALEDNCADCSHELLDVKVADVFNGQYTQQVVSYLQSHPTVKYVVADSGQLALGLEAAISQAGIDGVTIYGIGPDADQVKALQDGAEGAWSTYPGLVTGWIVADEVARVVVGDDPDLWLDEELAYVLTKDNVEGIDLESQEFPADYQDQFKALWNKE